MYEGQEMEVIHVQPKLHDRWSLLLVAMQTLTEVSEVITNNLSTLSMITAQHMSQKQYDRKFKEIANGNPSVGTGSVQSED